MALSPDGRWLASGGFREIKLWERTADTAIASNWKLVRVIEPARAEAAPADRVQTLHFSPNGRLLASGGGAPGRGGELLLWNVGDGSLVREFRTAHKDTVYDVKFSPDGLSLASASADRFARVFDVSTGEPTHALEGHTGYVQALAWKADGKKLATAGADGLVNIWDLKAVKDGLGEKERVKTILGREPVSSLCFLGESDVLATSRDSMEGNTQTLHAAATSRDGKIVLMGGQEGVLWLRKGDPTAKTPKFTVVKLSPTRTTP
jgi:WD40 repeat protein